MCQTIQPHHIVPYTISLGLMTVFVSLLLPVPSASAQQLRGPISKETARTAIQGRRIENIAPTLPYVMKSLEKKDPQTLTRKPHRLIRKPQSVPLMSVEPSPSSSFHVSSLPTPTPPLQTDSVASQFRERSSANKSVAVVPLAPMNVVPSSATATGYTTTATAPTRAIPLAAAGAGNSSTSGQGGGGGRTLRRLIVEMPELTQLTSPPSAPVLSFNSAIGTSPTSLSFTAQQGSGNPPTQTLSISNTGSGSLNWSASENTSWLSLSPASGNGNGVARISVTTGSLTAGSYSGVITLTATGTAAVRIPVALTILPLSPPPSPPPGPPPSPPPSPPPGNTVVGLAGDKFTINGQPTFLLGISYFDVAGWRASDLDALQMRRFNLVRIFLDWGVWLGGNRTRSFFNPDGSMKNTTHLLDFVRACAARGIIVDATILHNNSNELGDWNGAFPQTAIRNAVRLLANEPNVFFDLVNEHNGFGAMGTSWSDSHTVMQSLVTTARQESGSAILTFSSMSATFTNHAGHILMQDDSVIAANIDEELATGINLVAPHFGREPDWHDRTDRRVSNLKNYLASLSHSVPVYLQEENRRGDGDGSGVLPKEQFFQAASEAKNVGAAAWLFHTEAGFNLSTQDIMSRLDPVELQIADSIGSTILAGAGMTPVASTATAAPAVN